MVSWTYIIKGGAGTIITGDPFYAEMKSKLGYIVFCKRENNIYKSHH